MKVAYLEKINFKLSLTMVLFPEVWPPAYKTRYFIDIDTLQPYVYIIIGILSSSIKSLEEFED